MCMYIKRKRERERERERETERCLTSYTSCNLSKMLLQCANVMTFAQKFKEF